MNRQDFIQTACAMAMHAHINEAERSKHVLALRKTAEQLADELGIAEDEAPADGPSPGSRGVVDMVEQLASTRDRCNALGNEVERLATLAVKRDARIKELEAEVSKHTALAAKYAGRVEELEAELDNATAPKGTKPK